MAFGRTQTTHKPTATATVVATVGLTRISPAAILAAYAKPVRDATGRPLFAYRPIRGRWTDGMLGCDALSAVVSRRLGKDEPMAIGSLKWAAGQLACRSTTAVASSSGGPAIRGLVSRPASWWHSGGPTGGRRRGRVGWR